MGCWVVDGVEMKTGEGKTTRGEGRGMPTGISGKALKKGKGNG